MSPGQFTYVGQPSRVLFGAGRRKALGSEAAALGMTRVLVVSTPQRRWLDDAQGALGSLYADAFSGAVMHTPSEVTRLALDHCRRLGADGIVSIGGGSAIGLGKALALQTDLPQIALPSTFAGSEVTDILGQTKGGAKTTLRSPKVLPETVIYDVDLAMTLPADLAAVSGLNAMAHALEALYAPDANPVISIMAQEGLTALTSALPPIVATPDDRAARSRALYGAWLCGICLGATAMSLHHKLCHLLGGLFNLPHAQTHAVILPHAAAYNLPAAPDARDRAARALDGDPVESLWTLAGRIGAPRSLRELGMPQSGLDAAVTAALASPYANPRPLERNAVHTLLARAWAGEHPSSD